MYRRTDYIPQKKPPRAMYTMAAYVILVVPWDKSYPHGYN